MDIKEYFENKSVCFVGPSPYLIGQNMGEFIDSFDIVVKTNGAYNLPKELEIDYGQKCDVLFLNFLFSKKAKDDKNIDKIKEKTKIIFAKNTNFKNLLPEIATKAIDIKNSWEKFKKSPLIGSLALNTLIKYDFKKLYLIGFDFFEKEESGKIHFDKYLPIGSPRDKITESCHDLEENLNFWKNTIKNNNKIEYDQKLEDILNG